MNHPTTPPTATSPAASRFAPAVLRDFSVGIFVAAGMRLGDAQALSDNLVDSDLHGVSTHGMVRIPGYLAQLESGDVDPRATAELEQRAPASAIVNGGGTFGAIGGTLAMTWAIDAAAESGIAMCGARNVAHFGAAGYFSRLASSAGMIGIAMTNTPPAVATTGAVDIRLGNNPLAISVPGDENFTLDLAMSVVSRGRVKLMADAGKPIPQGWALNAEGHPTTDAQEALDGALLPFGGYKGAGLAVAVEILAAALTGAQLTQAVKPSGMTATAGQRGGIGSVGESVTVGHLFIAIDPSVFRPLLDFEHDVSRIVKYVLESKTLPGSTVKIAGQDESALASRLRAEGIPLEAETVATLNSIAERVGAPTLSGSNG